VMANPLSEKDCGTPSIKTKNPTLQDGNNGGDFHRPLLLALPDEAITECCSTYSRRLPGRTTRTAVECGQD
jgi:hypothetical protein